QLVTGELARRPELVGPWFAGLDRVRAARALTVLARAAVGQVRAIPLLRAALAADLGHLAVPALAVAVGTNAGLGELLAHVPRSRPVSRETLTQVAEEISYPSFALAAPAAVVLQLLADNPADDAEAAETRLDLSAWLGELGRWEEALDAVEEAV